jgi:hypothetical protein
MLEILMPVAAFLTQFFSEKFLEWGLDRIHLAKVKDKLDLKIQVVLQESIADFSDGTYIIENFDVIGYFQDPIVLGELSLLVRPSDNREPDVKVLQDIWETKLGSQIPGNYQLILLEPVCKIGKQENGSNGNPGRKVGSSFFIASGDTTKLLEAMDEPFKHVSLVIVRFIERRSAMFIATTSNGATNMMSREILSKRRTGVRFVCHQALWP